MATNSNIELVKDSAAEAWAAYVVAMQAVETAGIDCDFAELERLWMAAELASNKVKLLCADIREGWNVDA